ncbi:mimitin, mitochondrial [Pelobates cultripes]|uniref:Mimitin, mitochondrial n=1 Tax=Pelobates cultripes TaxID=61616 RepID=A0AAD1WBC3_PELCU|nr:mimitin, mitochondrial [Pelobates cultripes]
MDKLRIFLQRTLGRVRHHVGTDQFGNKYYYIPEQATWTGQRTRARRTVDCVNKKEFEYQLGNIPTEWEAWIRGKRKDPPTIEEILKNEKFREEMKMKSKEASQDSENKVGALDRPEKTQVKGHASANVFGRPTISEEPTSTGNTFTPGSWSPGQKDQKK